MSNDAFNPISIKKYWKDMHPPDLTKLKSCKMLFEDTYFPINRICSTPQTKTNSSINEDAIPSKIIDDSLALHVNWRRLSAIKNKIVSSSNWVIFPEGKLTYTHTNIHVQDCYFMTTIMTLIDYPSYIGEKFLIKDYNEEGYYEIVFFIDGEWQIVFVDDWLPFYKKNNNFVYAKPIDNAIWLIIIEKAWAKLNGGYSSIVKGNPADLIYALTRFPAIRINHAEIEKEELVDGIKFTREKDAIKLGVTKNFNKNEIMTGLISNHLYTLNSIKTKGNVSLIKVKDSCEETLWKGDWCVNSTQWTKVLKKFYGKPNKSEGEFFIASEDYLEHFTLSTFTYMFFGASNKTYQIKDAEYLTSPLVFCINIKDTALTAITIHFNNSRFNYDKLTPFRPFSMLLCKYNDENIVTDLYSLSTLKEDCSLIEILKPGNYILWLCCHYKHIKNDPFFKYTLSIISKIGFESHFIGFDKKYKTIKRLAISHYEYHWKTKMDDAKKHKESVLIAKHDILSKASIYGYFISNLSPHWINIHISLNMKHLALFPPFEGATKFNFNIPPNQTKTLLAFKHEKEAYVIGISSSSYTVEKCKTTNTSIEDIDSTDIFSDVNKDDPFLDSLHYSETIFKTRKQASIFHHFNPSTIEENDKGKGGKTEESSPVPVSKFVSEFKASITSVCKKQTCAVLTEKYPDEMEVIMKLPAVYSSMIVSWGIITYDNGKYIGEINLENNDRHGRGCYLWNNGMKMISNWENDKYHVEGEGIEINPSGKVYKKRYSQSKLIEQIEIDNPLPKQMKKSVTQIDLMQSEFDKPILIRRKHTDIADVNKKKKMISFEDDYKNMESESVKFIETIEAIVQEYSKELIGHWFEMFKKACYSLRNCNRMGEKPSTKETENFVSNTLRKSNETKKSNNSLMHSSESSKPRSAVVVNEDHSYNFNDYDITHHTMKQITQDNPMIDAHIENHSNISRITLNKTMINKPMKPQHYPKTYCPHAKTSKIKELLINDDGKSSSQNKKFITVKEGHRNNESLFIIDEHEHFAMTEKTPEMKKDDMSIKMTHKLLLIKLNEPLIASARELDNANANAKESLNDSLKNDIKRIREQVRTNHYDPMIKKRNEREVTEVKRNKSVILTRNDYNNSNGATIQGESFRRLFIDKNQQQDNKTFRKDPLLLVEDDDNTNNASSIYNKSNIKRLKKLQEEEDKRILTNKVKANTAGSQEMSVCESDKSISLAQNREKKKKKKLCKSNSCICC